MNGEEYRRAQFHRIDRWLIRLQEQRPADSFVLTVCVALAVLIVSMALSRLIGP